MLDSLRSVVHPIGGVVSRVAEVQPPPGIDVAVVVADAGWADAPGARVPLRGTGVHQDRSTAETAAVCEALERYASCFHRRRPIVEARRSELDADVVSLEGAPWPGCAVVAADKPVRWLRGERLLGGEPVWVPAALALMTLPLVEGEDFGHPNSSGCAVHVEGVAAAARALLEVIERDAIALLWSAQRPLDSIHPATVELSGAAPVLIEQLAAVGISVRAYDATSDIGIPVAYVVAEREGGCWVAAAAAVSLTSAVEKALYEAVQVHLSLGQTKTPTSPSELRSASDFGAYMASPDRREAFAFVSGRGTTTPPSADTDRHPPSAATALSAVVAALAAADRDAVVVDVTTGELRDVGLTCRRAVVPSLQPFVFAAASEPSPQRLAEYRAAFSLAAGPVNPWPNPFA